MENIPYLTTNQMREVDRAAVEDFQLSLIQMMENAGRSLAALARRRFLEGDPRQKRVLVLAGTGGNGGGGLVCARRLHNWGAEIEVILTRPPEQYQGVPAHQLQILQTIGAPILVEKRARAANPFSSPDLIIDALIGYGLSGPPRGTTAALISWANSQAAPILSLDTPSGLETTEGKIFQPVIEADATLTLALPKTGFQNPAAAGYIGELYLADLGIPPELYARPPLNLQVGPLFADDEILRISWRQPSPHDPTRK